MRISDWSSDVCSSDLKNRGTARTGCWDRHKDNSSPAEPNRLTIGSEWTEAKEGAFRRSCPRLSFGPPIAAQRRTRANGARVRDRKSVGWGQSVSVRVVLGGCRHMKKKQI